MKLLRGSVLASRAAVGAGHVVRFTGFAARLLPGLAGAAGVSWGAWLVYRPAGVIAAGVLLLAADRQIALTPQTEGRP